jgi:hypothetical protein
MQISAPDKIITPWATSGLKATIPETADPVLGRAGFDQGFPAINMTPKTAGGIPPFGQDFNGIFFDVTQALQFMQAGGTFPYDGTWAAAVGGYPAGALVSRTDNQGLWRNTAANNLTDPEAGGAGWQPEGSGSTAVTMTSSNVTLTPLQAARGIIVITGALTANLQLIFPDYVKPWVVQNATTGGFTVLCKTVSGAGVSTSQGQSAQIYGDGTSIVGSIPPGLIGSGIRGSYSNLSASAVGTNATVSFTADAICVKNAANEQLVLNTVSESCNLLTSGAGGLDAGSLTANTWYATYLIYNPTTSTRAAITSTSYTGPALPSGFTHWAFIESVRCGATATRILPMRMDNGDGFYLPTAGTDLAIDFGLVLNGGTATSATAVSLSAFCPPNAKSGLITINCAGPSTGTAAVYAGSTTSTGLLALANGTGALAGRYQFSCSKPNTRAVYYLVAGSGVATISVVGWRS